MPKISSLNPPPLPISGAEKVPVVQGEGTYGMVMAEFLATLLAPYTEAIDASSSPAVAFGYELDGAPVISIDQLGKLVAPALDAGSIAGLPARGMVPRRAAVRDLYRRATHFISHMGQSVNDGNKFGANHTIAQEYGLIAFPTKSTAPSAYYPAVATSETVTGTSPYGPGYANGESPMFGMSYIGEVIEARDGLRIDAIKLRLLVCCNATGGTTIGENSKGGGTGNYERTISQVAAAKNIAAAEGEPFVCRAVVSCQGESNDGQYGSYMGALQSLYTNLATDIGAITESADPFYLIINQTNSVTANRSAVARAQFDQSKANPNIIISTPTYFLEFADQFHPTARSCKWLGAYNALAYLWTVIEGTPWKPLSFTLDQVIGNYVYLKAEGNFGPLVFDEVTIPAQTASGIMRGFSAVDASNAVVNVTSVELAGDSRLRIGLASIGSGFKVQYAIRTAAALNRPGPFFGLPGYQGAAGNVRDSLGDFLPLFEGGGVRRRMHRWGLAQEITLP